MIRIGFGLGVAVGFFLSFFALSKRAYELGWKDGREDLHEWASDRSRQTIVPWY